MNERLSILLIEDNPGDARLIREHLRECGLDWELEDVATLGAGLTKLAAGAYDLVLLDLGLPDAQGLDALSRIRSEHPDVPVVILTGQPDQQLGLAAIGQGAQDFLIKGEVQAREFSRILRYTVERTRARREKEEAQAARQASEGRLRVALDAAGLGTFDYDVAAREVVWDAVARSLWGVAGGEPSRQVRSGERVHPMDRARVRAEVMASLVGNMGERFSSEFRIVWPDGSVHWTLTQGEVKFQGEGRDRRAVRMVGVHADITQAKRLEEVKEFLVTCGATEPRESFFQSLARFLGHSLCMDFVCIDRLEAGNLAASTLAVYFDGEFQDNVTYALQDTPCGDVVGKTVCNFPRGVRHLFPKDQVLQNMGAESYFGATLFGNDGKPIGLIALIARRPEANPKFISSVIELVAIRAAAELERTDAETKLRNSEAMYRALFEQSGDFVWVFRYLPDRGLVVVDANEAAAAGHGYAREELLGQPLSLFDNEVRPEMVAERMGALAAGVPLLFTARHRRKDGSFLDVEVRTAPVRIGEESFYLAVERDITERRQLEAQKQQLEANLRQAQKMEAVGTLAGGIAHDFNNILTPIMAHGELALMQLPEGDPVRDDISELLLATERAASLVKQILAISRKEDQGVPVPVNVGALVKETAKFLRSSIPTTIEIRIDVDSACGPVLAEPTRLHQVILNLATNASYAMAEKGGVLTLSLHREEEAGRRWVKLTVDDTGPGIPREVLGRIFEPYFTTKPVGKGSGLGLAVVHGIVTTLGGEIRVSSAPGEGATFDVRLPETERSLPQRHVPVSEMPRGVGQRVLAVDDEESIRVVLERLLKSLGYRVTTCGNGPEALEVFRADPQAFDVVLTDYTMPGMTGMALAVELRALRPELPIVLGTGFAEGVDEKAVAAAGLQGPLMKPYSAQTVGDALRGVLGA